MVCPAWSDPVLPVASEAMDPEEISPRGTAAELAAAPMEVSPRITKTGSKAVLAPPWVHPQKWSEEQVRAWWERRTRRRKDVGTPARGTDGRNIMRWPVTRFEQLCNGNTGIAVALFQDLRNEIERYEQWRRSGGGTPTAADLSAWPKTVAVAEDAVLASPRVQPRPSPVTRPPAVPEEPHVVVPHMTAVPQSPAASTAATVQSPAPVTVVTGQNACCRGPVEGEQVRQVAATAADMPLFVHRSLNVNGPTISPGRRGSGVIVTAPAEDRRCRRSSVPNGPAKASPVPSKQQPTPARADFKFSPCQRGPPQQPPTPVINAHRDRRPATAVDPLRAARDARRNTSPLKPSPGKETQSAVRQRPRAEESTVSAAKMRTKSAPRPTRVAPTPPVPLMRSHVPASPSMPGRAVAGASKTARPAPRSLVMEDLGDETLARISTPKKGGTPAAATAGTAAAATAAAAAAAEPATVAPPARPVAARKVSVDDTEIVKRKKCHTEDLGRPGSNDEEDGATRRMFDKRELRRMHRDLFDQQLAQFRANHPFEQPANDAAASSRVRVCVRKRPLFAHESEEFDVVTVRGQSELVVHNCLTKADLRSLFVSHMGFRFAHCFGEAADDDDVFAQCAAPAVRHVQNGGVSSLFMFGQTGSGKTHTMAGLLKRAAEQLFSGQADSDGEPPPMTLAAFEIAGRTMRDLLDTSNTQKELKVMEDKDHRTHVLGVKFKEVPSAQDLLSLVEGAQAHRATRATQVNDTSSRSHAVYRIYLSATGGPPAPVLTLVDCAGSERREDSTHHDSQSRKDAAEINSTIFALKECFRVMRASKGQQPPYRESLLTRVLSDSFSSADAMIVAIGTVSPSATDTEHSIGTLRALQQLQGTQMAFEVREDVAKPRDNVTTHPRSWSEEEVRHWLEQAVNGRAKAFAVSKGTDGKNLMRWPVQRFTQLCEGDEDLGAKLFQDLRARIRS